MQSPSEDVTQREQQALALRENSPDAVAGHSNRRKPGASMFGASGASTQAVHKVVKQIKILYLNIQISAKIYDNDTFHSFVRRVSTCSLESPASLMPGISIC